VTGIVADPPPNLNLPFRMLVSYDFHKRSDPYRADNWHGNYQGTAFVVLPEGYRKETFEKQLAGFKAKYLSPEYNARVTYLLQPLKEIHTNPFYTNAGSYVTPGHLLPAVGLVGLFIVLIAAVNFINLATAQAVRRSREVGVRKAWVPAGRSFSGSSWAKRPCSPGRRCCWPSPSRQAALSQINALLSGRGGWTCTWTAGVVGFAAATTLLVTRAGRFLPALVLSGYNPVAALKNRITAPFAGWLFPAPRADHGPVCPGATAHHRHHRGRRPDAVFPAEGHGVPQDAVVTVPLPNTGFRRAGTAARSSRAGFRASGRVSFSSGVPTEHRRAAVRHLLLAVARAGKRQAGRRNEGRRYRNTSPCLT
jgi:hypothetical protein